MENRFMVTSRVSTNKRQDSVYACSSKKLKGKTPMCLQMQDSQKQWRFQEKIKTSCARIYFRWRKERLHFLTSDFRTCTETSTHNILAKGQCVLTGARLSWCERRIPTSSAREAIESELERRRIPGGEKSTWAKGWSKSVVCLFHRAPHRGTPR